MAKKKQPNYYCMHCPHSGAMHQGPKLRCGGLDAAGDVCDCAPFAADLQVPPMEEPKKPRKKRVKMDWAHEQAARTLDKVFSNKDNQIQAVAQALRRAYKKGIPKQKNDWPAPGSKEDYGW